MQDPSPQTVPEKDRNIFSFEREKIPFEKVMPFQFKIIELMLPEQLREAVRVGSSRIEKGEDAGKLCDEVFGEYIEKYSQVFDDYCREYPYIVEKVILDRVSDDDYKHLINFFTTKAVFLPKEKIDDLCKRYLH